MLLRCKMTLGRSTQGNRVWNIKCTVNLRKVHSLISSNFHEIKLSIFFLFLLFDSSLSSFLFFLFFICKSILANYVNVASQRETRPICGNSHFSCKRLTNPSPVVELLTGTAFHRSKICSRNADCILSLSSHEYFWYFELLVIRKIIYTITNVIVYIISTNLRETIGINFMRFYSLLNSMSFPICVEFFWFEREMVSQDVKDSPNSITSLY